jgi:uncharacterized membrane protein YphA (DoxX/SURF4 family)
MNTRAAAAVMAVFLLVAVIFGNPAASAAGTPDDPTAVQAGR